MNDVLVKTRKPKMPRQPEYIFKGAMKLPLQERVDLVKRLQESITSEVETAKAAAVQLEKIANGS
jgi:hypothetical protein